MKLASVLLALVLCLSAFAVERPGTYTYSTSFSSNELLLPSNYRSWIALAPSTPGVPVHRHKHLATKLYVEPSSYEEFTKTGLWPNKTVIVLELVSNKPVPKGACNVMGLEAAVKDDSRFPDPWSYYGIVYDKQKESKLKPATCIDCEQPVDTILTMAFPTLRAVINAKPWTVTPSLF